MIVEIYCAPLESILLANKYNSFNCVWSLIASCNSLSNALFNLQLLSARDLRSFLFAKA